MSERSNAVQSRQEVSGDQNQSIGQVYGGTVVYVSGGCAIIHPENARPSPVNAAAPLVGENPYRGLLAFHEAESARFFGREAIVGLLWQRLRELCERAGAARVLAIYGPSGSGKSSVARAGLIPMLGERPVGASLGNRVVVMVPGTDPLQALADVLARIATNDATPVAKAREFADALRSRNADGQYDGLQRIAALLPEGRARPLVVLVDQFEEVYTLCTEAATRDAFIANLLYASVNTAKYVSTMVTLRSDFLGETHKHSELNQLFSAQGFLVPSMDEAALRAAIEKPALNAGRPLEPAIVDRLLEQTAGRDGALPLLQFTLTSIWEGLKLDIQPAATLARLGGVGGALAEEAQRVFDSLATREEKEIARRVFLGAVQLGEGAQDTRRRAEFGSLVSARDKPETVRRVIDRFADPAVRLLAVAGAAGQPETVEITHEAILSRWQLLREWLEASRDDLRFQRRLEQATESWNAQGRPEGSLWRPPDLSLLQEFKARAEGELTALQVAFYDACCRAESLRRVLKVVGACTLVGATIAMSVLAVNASRNAAVARLEQQQAELERQGVEARQAFDIDQLASLVQAVTVGRRLQALESTEGASNVTDVLSPRFALQRILANIREKYRLDVLDFDSGLRLVGATYDPASDTFLLTDGRTLQRSGFELSDRSPLEMEISDVRVVAFSPDGRQIAAGSGSGIVQLTNRLDGISRAIGTHKAPLRQLAFDPSGKSLAVIEASGRVRIWKLADDSFAEFDLFGAGSHPEDFCGSWSADGSELVVVSSDGSIAFWTTGGQLRRSGAAWERRQGAVCSPVGSYFATAEPDGTVRLWNHSDTRTTSIALKGHHRGVEAMSFSADGEWLTTTGEDGTLRVWRVRARDVREFQGHDTEVERIAFSPKDDVFATAGQDDQVKVWDLNGRLHTQFSSRHGIPRWIAFAPDGATIGTTGSDGKVRLWNVQTGRLLHEFAAHDGKAGWSVEFHPNRQLVVSAGSDNLAKLWDFSGKPIATLNGHQGFVWNAVFSPDGETVATASDDATVRLWRISGEEVRVLKGHRQRVLRVSFSPDGNRLATAGDDGVIIWNTNGEVLAKFKGHYGWIYGASFSPDGKLFATAGEDGNVRTWSALGYPLAEFNTWPALEAIQGMSFSRDGKLLATSADDGRIRLFALDDLNALLNQACDWLSGYLSAEEAAQLCPRIADRR